MFMMLLIVVGWLAQVFIFPVKHKEPIPAPKITTKLSVVPQTITPGGQFRVVVKIIKNGVSLASLSLKPNLSSQPVTTVRDFNFTAAKLTALNAGKKVATVATFKLSAGQVGQCYKARIAIGATTIEPVYVSKQSGNSTQLAPQTLVAKYCIAQAQTIYDYEVKTRGNIATSLTEFKTLTVETLGSALGWGRAGVGFRQVASGGDFTLWLSASNKMTSFSASGCDSTYSCKVGNNVIINETRWRLATKAWQNGGGSLRDYRNMVVNHETGHWLGFGHHSCSKKGALAPVMQQQSISLQGCRFNPWPLDLEITALKA